VLRRWHVIVGAICLCIIITAVAQDGKSNPSYDPYLGMTPEEYYEFIHAPALPAEIQKHVVVRGDSWWKVAETAYGKNNGWLYPLIVDANAPVLTPGQRVFVPRKNNAGGLWVVVKEGDSLWSIASNIYGSGASYPLIFEAEQNSRLRNLRPGQSLNIPPVPEAGEMVRFQTLLRVDEARAVAVQGASRGQDTGSGALRPAGSNPTASNPTASNPTASKPADSKSTDMDIFATAYWNIYSELLSGYPDGGDNSIRHSASQLAYLIALEQVEKVRQ